MIVGDKVRVVDDTFQYAKGFTDPHYREHIGREGVLVDIAVGFVGASVTHKVVFSEDDDEYDYFNQNELEVIK